MPILALEPDCFPPQLLDDPRGLVPEKDRHWWLVRTRSRREKDLTRRLMSIGAPFYCPIISRRSRSPSGRIREAYVPLFPGYVFLFGSMDERYFSLTTGCLSSAVAVSDEERLVRELASLRRLLVSNIPVTPEERLQSGTPVRVVSGPLRGQEGIVVQRRGRRRLLVAVELLQRGVSAELDECDIEVV